jgi:uncharacterized protein (UPF0261 family)
VPEKYRNRQLHAHNANVTLMRTTAGELAEIAAWICEKLNRSSGPVRMLLPEGGLSALDAPGQKFHDPEAREALFTAFERNFAASGTHRLLRVPFHINDAGFAAIAESHIRDVMN